MPDMDETISFNKYLPVTLVYFFFNSFLLPSGMLYTTLLTPLLLLWLFKYPSVKYILYFFLLTVPYIPIHFWNGVDATSYIKSYLLILSAFIFGLSFYQFLKVSSTLRSIFRQLLLINFIFFLIACVAWFFASTRDIFWLTSSVTVGLQLSRLKLLTYEPSYYSTLLVPVAMYYYLKLVMLRLPNPLLTVALITIPLLLSFSLGILVGIPLSFAIMLLLNPGLLLSNKKTGRFVLAAAALVFISFVALLLVYPNNPLFTRIYNIFEGRDTSFQGRTVDSFYLAWEVIKQKSILFGVGPGQVKIVGLKIWQDFYQYNFTMDSIAIPCAAADTMAVYGITGLLLRIGLQIFFFFRTRVYSNYYRMALFIFIFIYQFTGSYINNIAEFVIWILAFTNVFEEFDKKKTFAAVKPVAIQPA